MDESNEKSVSVNTQFKSDVIREILKLQFTNPKNKISDEAVDLIGEIMKTITVEAAVRASMQASSENKQSVTLEHVETILPQLMLDLP